jgi:hypothetical protein
LGRLSKLARLSENNCRLNIRNLIAKLALEEIKAEISAAGIGKTYRVYNYSTILQRRKAAGMEWVIRTKGVVFVDPNRGMEVISVPHIDPVSLIVTIPAVVTEPRSEAVRDSPTEPTGGAPTETAALISKDIRKFFQQTSSSELCSLVAQTLRQHVNLDDDAVRQVVERCRQVDQAATAQEIIYFARMKIAQHRNMRSVRNAIGLLIDAVPKCFEGTMIAEYRAHVRQRTEEGREVAKSILDDPNASEEDRTLARSMLS